MQTYVVRRPGVATTAAELDAVLVRLRSFAEKPRGRNAQWICSYALREPGERFGLACVFQSDSVQTLQEHAELVRTPAREILHVASAFYVRAFAPRMVYLIRRRSFWHTLADLESCASTARCVADDEMAREVQWLHSYAVDEGDGMLGTVSFYQSVSPHALRKHAQRVGMPADEITPVIGRVVYRQHPQEQQPRSRVLA